MIQRLFRFFEGVLVKHLPPDGTAATTYALAAGVTDPNSGSMDRQGYSGVAFLVTMGNNADTGSLICKVEHSDDDVTFTAVDDEDAADVAITVLDASGSSDDEMVGIEVYGGKLKRYVRLSFTRATANTVIAALHGFLIGPHDSPVTQSTSAGQFNQAVLIKEVVA